MAAGVIVGYDPRRQQLGCRNDSADPYAPDIGSFTGNFSFLLLLLLLLLLLAGCESGWGKSSFGALL